MKRTISLLLPLALLLGLLPACSQSTPEPPAPEPEVSASELAAGAFRFSGYGEELNTEYLSGDRLTSYIEAVFGLTADQWKDAMVIRGTGASAFEIVVLRLGDEDAAAEAETVLTDYLTVREGAFTGYAPDEAEMASNGRVRREGRTVGIFICPDPAGAEAAFTAACSGEALPPLPEPEPEPAEEPEDFTPAFEIHDLLFRLLLEAACPEWGGLGRDRGWTNDKREWAANIAVKYGISADQFEDYANAYWGAQRCEFKDDEVIERNIHEIILFQAATEDGAGELVQALNDYRDNRLEELGDCQPSEVQESNGVTSEDLSAEAEALKNALIVSTGHYAALILSEYAEDAVRLLPRAANDPDTSGFFRRFIDGLQPAAPEDPDPDYPDRTRFTPVDEEDMSLYDTSAILAAWEKRDPSGLSGDDAAIYEAAETILAEIMRDGMTDLEKEKAAYYWLVENVNYDWTHQDALADTDRRAYHPYGGLVDRSAVCLGYAASLQLLMDMSGVECITIVGAASHSTKAHGWNMVRLNGEWYCTDVAWDANARELADDHEWRYFNITSDEMAKSHQWDYANAPEATEEDRGGAAAE